MPIQLPDLCLRGLDDCEPLSQIAADDGSSFICCGLNDGSSRCIEQDEFRHCWVNEKIDEMSDWDARDITDTISVLSGGLSVMMNRAANEEADHDPD